MEWMQRAVAKRYRDEDGMTLIELMIVILVLGILATIVVLGIGAFTDSGKKQACGAVVGEVEAATAAYYSKNTAWPPNLAALVGAGNYLKSTPDASWNIAVNSGNGTVTATCPS